MDPLLCLHKLLMKCEHPHKGGCQPCVPRQGSLFIWGPSCITGLNHQAACVLEGMLQELICLAHKQVQ